MSSDLSVKIDLPIDTDLLLQDAGPIFSEILNVSFITPFCFWGSSIGLLEVGHSVCFDELEIEANPPWITTQAGVYAFTTTGGTDGISYAVAASLILALAYRYEANVIDGGSRWVKFPNPLKNDRGCSAELFQRAVANPREHSDLEAAGSEFFKRLPVFVADPGWVD